MFCKACGKEIDDGVAFCRYCGMATGASAGASTPISAQDIERFIQQEDEANKQEKHAMAVKDAAIHADHEYQALKTRWMVCLVAGIILAVALGAGICFSFIAYSNSVTPLLPIAIILPTIMGVLAGFFSPFGISLIKGLFLDKNISPVLFWVAVIVLYFIVLPLSAILGIPGIFILASKKSAARKNAESIKSQAASLM